MPKRASVTRLAKFRRDAEKLKGKYSNEEIAQKLAVKPANLSSYRTGAKNPGPKFLDKFYSIFGEEVNVYENLTDHEDKFTDNIADPDANIRYITGDDKDDHIHTLKVNNAYFRHATDEIVKSNQLLAQSNYILARSNQYMVYKSSPRRFKPKPPKSE